MQNDGEPKSKASLSEVQHILATELPAIVIAGIVLGITTLVPGIPAPVAGAIALFLLVCVFLSMAFRTRDGHRLGLWELLTNGLSLTLQFILFMIVLFLGLTILGGMLGILGR